MRIINVRRGKIACISCIAAFAGIFFFARNIMEDSDDIFLDQSSPLIFSTNEISPETQAIFIEGVLGNCESNTTPRVEGYAENGEPFHLPESKEIEATESFKEYGINVVASDMISPNRTLPDTRMRGCKYWSYPTELPSTSVVIPFHNEALSVLMRTVHSVINRSPPNILKQVVLVDDFSNKKMLKNKLEEYIKRWNGRVRIIRNLQREGLIRTRSRGAHEASGDVIVFLDAHCEVNVNWLPPLLTPILMDSNTVTVPIIEDIDPKTFSYRKVSGYGRGIFEWGLLYKETHIPKQEASKHKYLTEPYASPTHAGGLLAINRKYFLEIGGYDPGLLVWGGENYDLSFKVWLCGGQILWVPCSVVGHIYRPARYNDGALANNNTCDLSLTNFRRVVETWFDEEHKQFFYTREPLARYCHMGDMSNQIALKEKLKCKNFGWFMKNVAYDLYEKFPKLPRNLHWGTVKNVAYSLCLDTLSKDAPAEIGLAACHEWGDHQLFRLNEKGQLGVGERCVVPHLINSRIMQMPCILGTSDGPWLYDGQTQELIYTKDKQCLAVDKERMSFGLASCNGKANQKWIISNRDLHAVKRAH